MGEEIRAAGGVLRRRDGDGTWRYAIVHRPRYDDWSLPKGKLDEGERWEDAALREVEEETGLRARLLREVDGARYVDAKGRPKIVRYWLMEPLEGRFLANLEVDELRWLPLEEALERLTYGRDRTVLVDADGAADATDGDG